MKTESNLMSHRNAGTGTFSTNPTASDSTQRLCGDLASRSSSGGQFGTTITRRFTNYQGHFKFDSSGISSSVSSASFKFRGSVDDDRGISTTGTPQHDDCSIIFLKSSWDGTVAASSGFYPQYNDFTGIEGSTFFTASSDPDDSWDNTDVTLYSGEIQCNQTGGIENYSASLNSTAKTDIQNLSTFILGCIEYDQFYLKTIDLSYTTPTSNGTNQRMVFANMHNAITASYRPYIEYETGTVSAPVNNATFFGTNF